MPITAHPAQQMLVQGLLADLPLLFVTGQQAWHRLHGLCKVINSSGPKGRLLEIEFINPISLQPDVAHIWATTDDMYMLVDAEITVQDACPQPTDAIQSTHKGSH